jgi:cytochrome c553
MTHFHSLKSKKSGFTMRLLSVMGLILMTACSLPERSRALNDPSLSAKTIAMQVCSNCHGVTGVSTSPNFPNLAAQPQAYLVSQLTAFKHHGRSDPAGFEYMWGISSRLSEDQIAALATYFSELRAPVPVVSGNPERLAAGRAIFEQGITASGIPACAGCHGAHAEGMLQFPRLAGQHRDYLLKQLMVFQRTDERPEGAVMKVIVHNLTLDNMQDVTAYLETVQ